MKYTEMIYSFFWSFIGKFPFELRTAIFIGVLFALLHYPISRGAPVCFNILCILIGIIIKAVYIAVYIITSLIMQLNRNKAISLIYDRVCDFCEFLYDKIKACRLKTFSIKRLNRKYILLIYISTVSIIVLPQHFKFENKFMFIASLSNQYVMFESDTILKSTETIASFNSFKNNNSQSMPGDEIWLSLSEEGMYGTNVRLEPNAKSERIDTISGNDQVLYLNDQNGMKNEGWIYVRLKSGQEGWINGRLLEQLP